MARFGQTQTNFQPIIMKRGDVTATAYTPQDVVFFEFMGYERTDVRPTINYITAEVLRQTDISVAGQWDFEKTPTVRGVPLGSGGSSGGTGGSGADGREVILENDGSNIRWRYSGTATWTNLVALNTLQGARGPAGLQGATGATGLRGETGAEGPRGAAGATGASIEMRRGSTHIQWRVAGENAWVNLISIADITGPAGTGGGGTGTTPVTAVVFTVRDGALVFSVDGSQPYPYVNSAGNLVHSTDSGNPQLGANGNLVFTA